MQESAQAIADPAHSEIYRKAVTMIARDVERLLSSGPLPEHITADMIVPWFHHDFRSDLERYADILVRLKIMVPLTSRLRDPCFFRFSAPINDIARMNFNLVADRPTLEEVLGALTYARIDVWEIGGLFRDVAQIDDILPDLIKLGYVVEHDFGYIWLPKLVELQCGVFPDWRETDKG